MKKSILFLFVVIVFQTGFSQTLTPTVIASAGNYVAAGGISLSYTVGELAAIQTFKSANDSIILTQGFQQPNDILSGILDVEKEAEGAFSVYPVPAATVLWYGYEFNEPGKVEVSMYDLLGQKLPFIFTEAYSSGKQIHNLDCSSFASGTYFLTANFSPNQGKQVVLTKKIEILKN